MCLRANIVHFQITVHLFLSFYPAFNFLILSDLSGSF